MCYMHDIVCCVVMAVGTCDNAFVKTLEQLDHFDRTAAVPVQLVYIVYQLTHGYRGDARYTRLATCSEGAQRTRSILLQDSRQV